MNTKKTLPVSGMHCASCAQIISRTLKKLPGVVDATAHYATETVTVSYDSGHVRIDDMNTAVSKYGYTLGGGDIASSSSGIDERNKTRMTLVAFALSVIVFVVMLWENVSGFIPMMPMIPISEGVMSWILFTIATLVLVFSGGQFVMGVFRFVRWGKANMDTLVGLGTMAAYIYSSFILFFPRLAMQIDLSNNLFFDATIVVTGFVLFGKYLERVSKKKTGEALKNLIHLQAKTALVVRDGKEMEIAVGDVIAHERIIVKAGSIIPVDGIVDSGESSVDESLVTGESMPVIKQKGSRLIGGTINTTGVLFMDATKIGKDTVLSQIINMVEQAENSKAPIEKLADRISEIFVPAVLVLSVLTFILWIVLTGSFALALSSTIAVLVIACPCALGLATPVAVVAAVGRGARMGILVKDAERLEILEHVRTVVFDKTGTITTGKPVVVSVHPEKNIQLQTLLSIIGSLEAHSEHPVSHAIREYVTKGHVPLSSISAVTSVHGQGIQGVVNGLLCRAGTEEFLRVGNVTIGKLEHKNSYATPIYVSSGTQFLGVIYVADTVKKESKEAVSRLKEMGIETVLLSGDRKNIAEAIGREVGISRVIAEVTPEHKAEVIHTLKHEGTVVAMVGDGVNDAPALAYADVGIAMGTGSDVAISTSGLTIAGGDIRKISDAITLSKITMRVVRQNLFWAFAYNTVGIPLAMGVLYPFFHFSLPPVFAGVAMAASSVTVVLNALRLRTIKI
jgi:P-type Cu+ transporter